MGPAKVEKPLFERRSDCGTSGQGTAAHLLYQQMCCMDAGQRMTASRIYIDLTDLMYRAIWHSRCGGIARVQFEIGAAFVRSNSNAVPFSVYDGVWRDLRFLMLEADGVADRLLPRLKQFKPYPGIYPSFLHPLRTAKLLNARLSTLYDRLRSRAPRLTAADTLFVGGEFWTSRSSVSLCKRAAEQGVNLVILLHDLIPIINPQFTGHDFARDFLAILRLPAHFIVTTRFSMDELEQVRREKGIRNSGPVSIVPLADEFPGAQRNDRAPSAPKSGGRLPDGSFVLCVGTVAARKNHEMLLCVWEELRAELGDRLPALVVAGARGWKAEGALHKLDDLARSNSQVIFKESPSDELLKWLYSACLFTVFPSVLEGWGLPVGESLWFGKACAASNSSPIPEAGRDLCLYFSPDEPQQIKGAIRSLLDPVVRRSNEEKIKAARLRTWAEVAKDIKEVCTRRSAH